MANPLNLEIQIPNPDVVGGLYRRAPAAALAIRIPTSAEVASSHRSQAPAVPLAGDVLGDWAEAAASMNHNQAPAVPMAAIRIPTDEEVASSHRRQAPAVPMAGNALGDWGDADPSWSHNQVPAVPMSAIRIPTAAELASHRRQTPAPPSAAACAPGGSCGCTARDLNWPDAADSTSHL